MDLTAFAQEARSIAAKRSHVKQSFDELIEKMSSFVADIDDQLPIITSEALVSYEVDEGYEKRDIVLAYISMNDAHFHLMREVSLWSNKEGGKWEYERMDDYDYPTVSEIRKICPQLPNALTTILSQLRERGEVADEAQKAIGELLEKLR